MTDHGEDAAAPDALEDRAAALAAWMGDNVSGFEGPLTIRRFGVGQSNPTYRLSTPLRTYVLRRKPAGELLASAHAVDREFRVISGLSGSGVPVPRAYALCVDDAVIGSMFFVMEMVEGRQFTDGALPGVLPDNRMAVYRRMIETLARLHAIDPEAVGLEDFGRPGNYFTRQISRWERQYRSSQSGDIPAMDRLAEWLPRTAPDSDRAAIVHGDFRLDNLIWEPKRLSVAAVLDWELSTLGDPFADVAYLLTNWVLPPELSPNRSGFGGDMPRPKGIPSAAECLELYGSLAGRRDLPDLAWGLAFSLFRLAAIFQGIADRAQSGAASSPDAHTYAARVAPVAEIAWRCVDDPGSLESLA